MERFLRRKRRADVIPLHPDRNYGQFFDQEFDDQRRDGRKKGRIAAAVVVTGALLVGVPAAIDRRSDCTPVKYNTGSYGLQVPESGSDFWCTTLHNSPRALITGKNITLFRRK